MILLIDNFDSFTFNLVQVFQSLGANPLVLRNNEQKILTLATDPRLQGAIISPGPSHPRNTGLCLKFLDLVPRSVPVLGVCLGHQTLSHHSGVTVGSAQRIMHGKTSSIRHDGTGLFDGLPNPMQIGRYHSLAVHEEGDLPFTVTARTEDNEVMALAFKDRPWVGVQFHPESVLTPEGPKLLNNFLKMCNIRVE
ncbi:MAG: aminodeoxychorismate/anthranilate synthase component II [Desulfomicrobium sp.]|nr:aminodeoxychorismate/anthranilate synthase component II [Pseudomonadota bacterium]MBV1712229.1 aminodeoxychorismate/anthranilate synthase component II [Desulfomicrobium sp.]MBU4572867.1 aminodeoxychorismate/anthranilate synthase component II [Pseudomonadota bacterium]MBU4594862.1 aminodeoxychorismate/anthranilate synthase component II [Pseudomonadota bacterium]MBV1718499.1 aminodeoxychorismate/anthranilate synthase component II [Desulfomicrobium sp.]